MFLRDKRRQPIGCLAINIDSGKVSYQMSVLNPSDKFNREVSRVIALGRLIEKPIVINSPPGESMHDISLMIMNDIVANETAPARAVKSAKLWLSNTDRYTPLDKYEVVPSVMAEPLTKLLNKLAN
jgi:hypothetical protein